MAQHFQLTVLIIIIVFIPSIHCFLVTSDNIPNFIDRALQLIWEPSSLIRLWVGLDQLYNIALSWRTVAKKLATLPFGDDGSTAHVRIQEPRSFKYQKPSVASQWERFNKIYASSNLSPIVARARTQQVYQQQYSNVLSDLKLAANEVENVLRTESKPVSVRLPPLFLFQPQEVFLDGVPKALLQNVNHLQYSFANRPDPTVAAKVMDLQNVGNQNILLNARYAGQLGGNFGSSVSTNKVDHTNVLNTRPEERLNMFLGLLKNLGDTHTNKITSGNGL